MPFLHKMGRSVTPVPRGPVLVNDLWSQTPWRGGTLRCESIHVAGRSGRKKKLPQGYEVAAERFVVDVCQGGIDADAGKSSAEQ